jgi:hypothetical protein
VGKRTRLLSIANLMDMQFEGLEFDGKWLEAFGKPETNFKMIVFGKSGSGKSSLVFQFMTYLSQFERMLFVDYEEGPGLSLQMAVGRTDWEVLRGRVVVSQGLPVDGLIKLAKRRNQPKVLIINSIDHMKMSEENYIKLKAELKHKAIIFISHMENNEPKSRIGKFIEYDCGIKVLVKDLIAYVRTRYTTADGGGKPIVIWHEGAEDRFILKNKTKQTFDQYLERL